MNKDCPSLDPSGQIWSSLKKELDSNLQGTRSLELRIFYEIYQYLNTFKILILWRIEQLPDGVSKRLENTQIVQVGKPDLSTCPSPDLRGLPQEKASSAEGVWSMPSLLCRLAAFLALQVCCKAEWLLLAQVRPLSRSICAGNIQHLYSSDTVSSSRRCIWVLDGHAQTQVFFSSLKSTGTGDTICQLEALDVSLLWKFLQRSRKHLHAQVTAQRS